MPVLPAKFWRRGNGYVTGAAADNTRIPFGHPEGFIEAFANVYNSAAVAIFDEVSGKYPESRVMIFQIFAMELLEWLSLKPWSRVRNRKINGLNFPVSPNNFIYEQENRNYRSRWNASVSCCRFSSRWW